MKTTFQVKGMHCSSCKALIEDVCKDISGVTSCVVDSATGKAELEYTDELDLSLVKKEIEAVGSYVVEGLA